MSELWVPKIYTFDHYSSRQPFLGDAKALDVGCGGRKLPGAIGMDILSLPGVDVVHDLNITPWPFSDHTFDLVFLNHALEHVESVIDTMNEIHRVLKPGGRAVIQVPYFRSVDAYTDPTHKHFFTSGTLDYVIQDTHLAEYEYSGQRFRKCGFWFGWPHPSKNPLRQFLKSFIHARPDTYDRSISRLIPVRCVTWELEALP